MSSIGIFDHASCFYLLPGYIADALSPLLFTAHFFIFFFIVWLLGFEVLPKVLTSLLAEVGAARMAITMESLLNFLLF